MRWEQSGNASSSLPYVEMSTTDGPEAETRRPRVFLSYAARDSKTVSWLESLLGKHGLEVINEAGIPIGAPIRTVQYNAIRDADAVLVFVSPASDSSESVAFEIAAAVATRLENPDKVIIPVVTDKMHPLPVLLQGLQSLVVNERDLDGSIQRLSHQLLVRPTASPRVRDMEGELDALMIEMYALQAERELHERMWDSLRRERRQRMVLALGFAVPVVALSILRFFITLAQSPNKSLWFGLGSEVVETLSVGLLAFYYSYFLLDKVRRRDPGFPRPDSTTPSQVKETRGESL